LRPDLLEPAGDRIAPLVERPLRRPPVRASVHVDPLGGHPAGADHPGGACGGALDVASDTRRVLPVEDSLRSHRAEGPDQLRDLLRAPGAEALFLLARLVVAERRATPLDREASRLRALEEDVRG